MESFKYFQQLKSLTHFIFHYLCIYYIVNHSCHGGLDHGVLALLDGQLLGAVTFGLSTDFDRYLPPQLRGTPQGYVSEAVVQRESTGQGLGTRLLREALAALSGMGVQFVFIDRHEENQASAGMMRRAGFVEIETYVDPRRRPHGSGRTTVCRFSCADETGPPGP